MFDKINQLREMKRISDELSKESIETEKNGVKVVLNGKMMVETIQLNPELSIEEQESALVDCINDGMTKIQSNMASQMSGLLK
jgi:DNA-binding protein YbaB